MIVTLIVYSFELILAVSVMPTSTVPTFKKSFIRVLITRLPGIEVAL